MATVRQNIKTNTSSRTRVKVTIKPKPALIQESGGKGAATVECRMCDGRGVVPKSWYTKGK